MYPIPHRFHLWLYSPARSLSLRCIPRAGDGTPARGRKRKHKEEEGTMNSVHLIGRLATDVEVKEVNGGSKVSSFILAVDRTRKRRTSSASRPGTRRPKPPASTWARGGASPWKGRCGRTSTRRTAKSARPSPWWPSGSSTCSRSVRPGPRLPAGAPRTGPAAPGRRRRRPAGAPARPDGSRSPSKGFQAGIGAMNDSDVLALVDTPACVRRLCPSVGSSNGTRGRSCWCHLLRSQINGPERSRPS